METVTLEVYFHEDYDVEAGIYARTHSKGPFGTVDEAKAAAGVNWAKDEKEPTVEEKGRGIVVSYGPWGAIVVKNVVFPRQVVEQALG